MTNYAQTKDITTKFHITTDDLEGFLGTVFYMSLFGMNNCRRYWSIKSRVSLVADQMPLHTFERIRGNLHFVRNEDNPGDDEFVKFRPILEQFNRVAAKIEKEEKCSVDENTIAYKGRKSKLGSIIPKNRRNGGVNCI